MSVEQLRRELAEKDREIDSLRERNQRLDQRLQKKIDECEELSRQNRELRLSPTKRPYVDADDERDSTQWREKAHNLLSLLDQLQKDMQNDLRELENETFSPRRSSGGASTSLRDSAYQSTPPPSRPSRAQQVADEVVTRVEAVVDQAVPAATPSGGDDGGSGRKKKRKRKEHHDDAPSVSTEQAYAEINAAAKTLHQSYKEVRENIKADPSKADVWKQMSEPIKDTAKAAKSLSRTNGNADFSFEPPAGSDKAAFTWESASTDLIGSARAWVDSASGVHRSLRGVAQDLQEAVDAFERSMDNPSGSSHASAAVRLSNAMVAVFNAEREYAGI